MFDEEAIAPVAFGATPNLINLGILFISFLKEDGLNRLSGNSPDPNEAKNLGVFLNGCLQNGPYA